MINYKKFTVSKFSSLFYNKDGSTNIGGAKEEEIFIDCQRTTTKQFTSKKFNEEVPTNPGTNSIIKLFSTNAMKNIIIAVLIFVGFSGVLLGGLNLTKWWKSRQTKQVGQSMRLFKTRARSSTPSSSSST